MRGLGLTLVLSLLWMTACSEGAQPPTTPPPTTQPPSTTTTTTAPRDAEETTTTTEAITLKPPDSPIEAVVAKAEGLWLLLTSGGEVRVWNFPTALGFALGNEIVVAQAASSPTDVYPLPREGPVLVLSGDGLRHIDPPTGFSEIQLHDAGFLAGRAVVLMTVAARSDPETAEERLLLWDLETEEWTDLGVTGGWESGVRQAGLTDSGVAASLFGEGEEGGRIERRALDGSVTWQSEPGTGEGTIAWSHETGEILVLGVGFTGDAFLPVLSVRGFAEEDGSERRRASLELVLPEDLSIEGGFCSTAESTGTEVLCDQTYGGPLLIDVGSAAVRRYGELQEGVVTLVRHPR